MNQTWIGAPASSGIEELDESTRSWLESVPAAQPVPAPRGPGDPCGRARLVISRGPDAGTGFAISTPRTTIGRGRECDIVVDDITVSREHAELRRRAGQYVLVDGGSLNGTYLNRLPVESAELADGDEIWVGKVRFTFRTDA
ncbi:FHA domain-containing protein [Saccharopolyspora sp. K220]|uniref:FHA domain-containing protein n=1 Tax=Saccharopolyspora soli TaxID=2926618 RepID=UPI001F5A7198|nr:FHA domain-containing protein [Saccharopolyspora soli]MCI2418368.1 FHA domain-containing protein [Saccharopolyspora soli]